MPPVLQLLDLLRLLFHWEVMLLCETWEVPSVFATFGIFNNLYDFTVLHFSWSPLMHCRTIVLVGSSLWPWGPCSPGSTLRAYVPQVLSSLLCSLFPYLQRDIGPPQNRVRGKVWKLGSYVLHSQHKVGNIDNGEDRTRGMRYKPVLVDHRPPLVL